ncbi:hypothetical protein LTR36_002805 [Oleoguttula mirabilis]|uniref:Uncharacterized protein n=1 Tax=Oleoguttula mirabilis TaxID=1507867 RepID=A0AAV9JJM1_9PEZI|nr:hypothetical protein LTR36_002805 [Oleoguttula mirabilis]
MAAIPNNSRALAQATAVQPQHDEQWTCVVCGDTNSFGAGGQGRRPFAIDGPLYCVDCITEQFQLATDDESSWPPGIGSNTINIDDFVGVLPVDFVERYRAQEQIYNAGGALMRVHCPYDRAATETEPAERCNAFMGRLIQHEDIDGADPRHWGDRPGCPRYNNPNPRRDSPLPSWDKADYEIQDVARTLLDDRQLRLMDDDSLSTAGIPPLYPPSRERDLSGMVFAQPTQRPSRYRGFARRVVDIHDRLVRGDLVQLWCSEDDVRRKTVRYKQGHLLVGVLSALRQVATMMHNHSELNSGRLTPLERTLARIEYTHHVCIFRQLFRAYNRNFIKSDWPDDLRLDSNQGWQIICATLRPLQLTTGEDPATLRQDLADLGLMVEDLSTRHTAAHPGDPANAVEGRPLVTSIVAHLQAILAILKPRQLNDAGRLSLPDSVFVQSFRNALVDSLRSVDATPQAAQAFCDLDNDHAMAYELAHQLPTLAMDAADESDRGGEAGHWAENHAWLQDMLLSVGQERQQIAEADEDGQPRLEQLYHLLSELEPLFRHMATPPTMYLDIPAQAWNTALRIRDATGYKPGRGPVRAVFADAYAFLREILAMYDRKTPGDLDRTPASLLPQTERANFHRRYGVVCDNLIAKQERKIQSLAVRGQADRHTDVAIRLLSALQHLLRRLNEPGQHPRQGNQEMLDHVRESWIRLDYGWGDFENRTEWARGDDSVFTIVRAVLLAADRVMEINAQAETARALLVAHLRAAENALQSSTDGEYVGGISAAWDRDTAIWQSVDCNIHPDHADTFDALLDHIGQVLHLGGLPAVIRTGDSDREYTDVSTESKTCV